MQKRFRALAAPARTAGSPPARRLVLAAACLTGLLAVAVLVAWLSGRGPQDPQHTAPTPSPTATTGPPAPAPAATASPSLPRPPQLAEPVAYARAAAQMLWSYDTRTTGRDQHLAGMRAWMSRETKYADWSSVAGQVPDPLLWSRMADQDQHATGSPAAGYFPAAFKAALAENPAAITEAYIYVVTVTGKQQIAWKQGGGGAEERSVTLAVQCRPAHDCTLAAVAPRVTQ
ncbi:hypothetical protein ACFYVL_09255 [Streptomyces sp. NPDC004111]|uniref:hypothetical protein n=1 Tax=Streptomyces sp. NPDC004111 TaxID=3364690 RepID=UPI003681C574